MYLLALDASTKATGFAIFNQSKELVYSGCITASSSDLYNRLHKMVNSILSIVQELPISRVVVEEVIPDHSKNTNTFKALMFLQALLHIELHDKCPSVQIELMYPGSWRSTCGIHTGRGVKRETLKEADIRFANQTYNLNITSDDQADAICIGHAYLHPVSASSGDLNWE